MPEIGRFISEDPWPGDITAPQTLNPYPYVVNNPLKYVDPLGLSHKDLGPGGSVAPANKPSAVDKTTREVVEENTGNNTKYSDCPQGTGNGRRNIYYAGNANSLNIPVNIARQIASAGVGLLPIVGDVKDVQEVLTGYDIISGEKLTWIDRGITFICVFVPIVSGKAAREGLGLVDEGIDLAKTTLKNADEVVEKAAKSDPYDILKKNKIPQTLTDEEIVAANKVDLQMSLKKIDDKYLKKQGIDAHELKSDFVGNKNISKYDLYVETETGEIFIYQKGAKGQGIATGEYIK